MDKLTRRANLMEWLETHSVPPAEKSLFSQLKDPTNSFGEKLARRLERDYGMGNGFLDRKKGEAKDADQLADHLIELLALYQQSDDRGRENIMSLARSAAKHGTAKWARVGTDQAKLGAA